MRATALFLFLPTLAQGVDTGCLDDCEEVLLTRLGQILPGHVWVLKQFSAGVFLINRTLIDSVCSVYIGVRLCNWECGRSDEERRAIYQRNAVLEKVCVRKVKVVTKQLPCMERMEFDPDCCRRCTDEHRGCTDRVRLLGEVQRDIQFVRGREELYPFSIKLSRLCGLTVCQLNCQIHRLLRYCTPEAVFLLEEMAGTPFVPLEEQMLSKHAYDYWPDDCRVLADSPAVLPLLSISLLSTSILFFLLFTAIPLLQP